MQRCLRAAGMGRIPLVVVGDKDGWVCAWSLFGTGIVRKVSGVAWVV